MKFDTNGCGHRTSARPRHHGNASWEEKTDAKQFLGDKNINVVELYKYNPISVANHVVIGGIIEAAMSACSHNLQNRLNELGIPATFDLPPTGTHTWGYWQDDIQTVLAGPVQRPLLTISQSRGAGPRTTWAGPTGDLDVQAAEADTSDSWPRRHPGTADVP